MRSWRGGSLKKEEGRPGVVIGGSKRRLRGSTGYSPAISVEREKVETDSRGGWLLMFRIHTRPGQDSINKAEREPFKGKTGDRVRTRRAIIKQKIKK